MVRKIKQIVRDESGQALPLFALMLVALLGFMALSVDVGRLYYQKNELQNVADLVALAAAQEMMDDDFVISMNGVFSDSVPANLVASKMSSNEISTVDVSASDYQTLDYQSSAQNWGVMLLTENTPEYPNDYGDGSSTGITDYEQKKNRLTTEAANVYAEKNGVSPEDMTVTSKYRGNQGSVTVTIEITSAATLGQIISSMDPVVSVTAIAKVDRVAIKDGDDNIIGYDVKSDLVLTDPIV